MQAPTMEAPKYRRSVRGLDLAGLAAFGRDVRGSFPLSPAWVEGQAEMRTGLHDWGPDAAYRLPLQLLCDDFAAHPPSFVGRMIVRETFAGAAVNRLRIREAMQVMKPEPVDDPIFILGLHRSGTTLLHNLMSGLPGHASVPLAYLMSPVPIPGRGFIANATIVGSRYIAPEMWLVHPVQAWGPEECWLLLLPTFQSVDMCFHWKIPTYTKWIDQADLHGAYSDYKDTLALLRPQVGGRPVMKGPGHLGFIDVILDLFPKARVVWLHRDPVRSVASFATLSAIQHRTIYGDYDAHDIGARVLARNFEGIERGMRVRRPEHEDRIVDLHYERLAQDKMGTIRWLCDQLDLDFDAATVQAAFDNMPKHKEKGHKYTPEQWGLSAEGIRERFASYIQRFDVPPEPW